MKLTSFALLLVLAPFTIAACSKDKKDDGDAAADATAAVAEAAAPVAVADAATEAAAVAVLDAAVVPIGVAATVKPIAKPVPKVDPPICAKARVARGRNSPAAPGLEQQCRAEGGTP